MHDSRLLHAVTRIQHGVRYSLIIFFGKKAVGAEGEAAEAFERFVATLSTEERDALKVNGVVFAPVVAGYVHTEVAVGDATCMCVCVRKEGRDGCDRSVRVYARRRS